MISSAAQRPRVARGGILIVGGGSPAGHLARELGTGTIVAPESAPVPTVAPNGVELVFGSAVSIDPELRKVEIRSQPGALTFAYAELVLIGRALQDLGLPADVAGAVWLDETGMVLGTRHIWAIRDQGATPEYVIGQARALARRIDGRG